MSNKIRNLKMFRLQRIATQKCFYMPDNIILKRYARYGRQLVIDDLSKRYPELDKNKFRETSLIYEFDIDDIIPLNIPIENLHPLIYYKLK